MLATSKIDRTIFGFKTLVIASQIKVRKKMLNTYEIMYTISKVWPCKTGKCLSLSWLQAFSDEQNPRTQNLN